jgi:hypothetical protein
MWYKAISNDRRIFKALLKKEISGMCQEIHERMVYKNPPPFFAQQPAARRTAQPAWPAVQEIGSEDHRGRAREVGAVKQE